MQLRIPEQGYTGPGLRVPGANTFCTVAPNICVPLVWYLFHITLLGRTDVWWLSDFCKSVYPVPEERDLEHE